MQLRHYEAHLISIFTCLIFSVSLAMAFKPPGPTERLRAIGSTQELPRTHRLALDPSDDFEPIPVPEPGDWLAVHPESGQTVDDFIKWIPNKPDVIRNKIYLQPLGDFPEKRSPSLETIKEYAAAYFMMDVKVLPSLAIEGDMFTTRINPFTRNRQILTVDVLDLLKKRLAADAFCLLAITMEDLYPDPRWNFVFGQASSRERVGVFSFARYDPAFYGEARGNNYGEILLRRSCKVLVHETGHMFSLQHCIFFRCVMNGSNHLRESDSRPLALCPVCLRKLQLSIGFDYVNRYRRLLRFYQKIGFYDDAHWVEKRLNRISGDENGNKNPK